MHDPTETAVRKTITREEAARHCRRQTRGVAEIKEMLESLLLSFSQGVKFALRLKYRVKSGTDTPRIRGRLFEGEQFNILFYSTPGHHRVSWVCQ